MNNLELISIFLYNIIIKIEKVMETKDYVFVILGIIPILISLIPYKEIIGKKVKETYEHPTYKRINNWVISIASIFMIIGYVMTAMLLWVLNFNCSVNGFYICLVGLIPIIAFANYFYRVNYEIISSKK